MNDTLPNILKEHRSLMQIAMRGVFFVTYVEETLLANPPTNEMIRETRQRIGLLNENELFELIMKEDPIDDWHKEPYFYQQVFKKIADLKGVRFQRINSQFSAPVEGGT